MYSPDNEWLDLEDQIDTTQRGFYPPYPPLYPPYYPPYPPPYPPILFPPIPLFPIPTPFFPREPRRRGPRRGY